MVRKTGRNCEGRGDSVHKVDLSIAKDVFQEAIEHVHCILKALVKVDGN
jgi:hypothetical protein